MNSFWKLASIATVTIATGIYATQAMATPPEGTLSYVVDHRFLGDVGLNVNTITYDGDRIIIESKGDLVARPAPSFCAERISSGARSMRTAV